MADFESRPMACRVCRQAINRFTDLDGEQTWVHARGWEEHDHEVEPVRGTPGVGLSCDFCGELNPRWSYEAAYDMNTIEGDLERGLGRRWAACDGCDPYVRTGNLDGVMQRHVLGSAFQMERAKVEKELVLHIPPERIAAAFDAAVADKRRIIGTYLRMVVRRGLIPPPPPPPVALTAVRLPQVRERLYRMWDSGLYRRVLPGPKPAHDPVMLPGEDVDVDGFSVQCQHVSQVEADRFCDRMARASGTAELYWISAEFSALAVARGKKLPDLTITREEVPATSGLLVYAQPIMEIGADGSPALVVAAGWTIVPDGVWLILYCQPEQLWPSLPREKLRADPGFLMPVAPGAGIQFGRHELTEGFNELEGAGAWGTLLATWLMMAQPGVATVSEQLPDRKSVAKARRAGNPSPPSVKIVDVRPRPSRPRPDGEPTGTRVITKRSLVGMADGGFWRDQAYGPNWSLRRRQWIDSFVRGPDGAPFAHEVDPPVVKVLR